MRLHFIPGPPTAIKFINLYQQKCTTNLSQAAPFSAFFSQKDTGGYKRQVSWVPQPQCLFELLLRVHEVAVPVNLNIGIKSSVYMYTVHSTVLIETLLNA